MNATTRCLALCIMAQGRDKIPADEIEHYANLFGVTTRSIYRYLDKIGQAKFYIKDALAQRMAE